MPAPQRQKMRIASATLPTIAAQYSIPPKSALLQREILQHWAEEFPTTFKTTEYFLLGPRKPIKKGESFHSSGVMVWAGVSTKGKTRLVFMKNVIKINAKNYVSDVLEAVVIPWAEQNYPDQQCIFQQGSAPARQRHKTSAKPIFRASSLLKNSRPTRPIWTRWTRPFGGLLRQRVVLSPTIWWSPWNAIWWRHRTKSTKMWCTPR